MIERVPDHRMELIRQIAELRPRAALRLDDVIRDSLPPDLKSVTPRQMIVLRRLAHGPIRMSQVARLLNVGENAATAIANRLVATGLIERLTDPADRRVVQIGLTETGRPLLERYWAGHRQALARIVAAAADDQLRHYIDVLGVIVSAPSD